MPLSAERTLSYMAINTDSRDKDKESDQWKHWEIAREVTNRRVGGRPRRKSWVIRSRDSLKVG